MGVHAREGVRVIAFLPEEKRVILAATMGLLNRLMMQLLSPSNVKAVVRHTSAAIRKAKSSLRQCETEAIQDLLQRATQGDAKAQYDCGEQYLRGDGLPQDDREAARWIHLAADQGHAKAQATLGMLCALGRGVPKDEVEACKWVSLAIAQKQAGAERILERLRGRLTPDQLAAAKARADEWQRSRESGRPAES